MPTIPIISRARALYAFKSNDKSSLQFEQGDCIDVLNKLKSGWWDGWCNGSRGWFPSNYVHVIEELSDAVAVELPNIVDTAKQQQDVYVESLGSSSPMLRVPKNGVPLQRNQEHRISLPYNHTIDIQQHQQRQYQYINPEPSLPANWIMEMTEDGTDCYYYNKLTGEMQTLPPIGSSAEIQSRSESNHDATVKKISNTKFDACSELGDTASYENDIVQDDDSELRSVSSRLDDRKVLPNPLININHTDSSDHLPSSWVKRTNHQGRTYYCNIQTQDTTWDMKNIDPITGRLFTDSGIPNQLTTTLKPIEDDSIDSKVQQRMHDSSSSENSANVYLDNINKNEPLTWHFLSTRIAISINDLNQCCKNNKKPVLTQCAGAVINSIRFMLLASGTIDKNSAYIKSNAVLRGHHRTMMAAMSKVMLTSFLAADNGGNEVNKLIGENNDLLVAVRNFVGACQDLSVPVEHIDPKLVLEKSQEGESKQPPNQGKAEPAKYALQHDLADNLDVYGTNMHESVDAILFSIKSAGRLESGTQTTTDTSRFQMGASIFTQFRNLSNQTGQFIGLVDDIDFDAVENSPLMTDIMLNKQALSGALGRLFCHLQQLTNQHMPLGDVLFDIKLAAESIHIPIHAICECINIIVYDHDIENRPSMDVNIKTGPKKTPLATSAKSNEPYTTNYGNHSDHIEDVHYDDGQISIEDDHTTYMDDSIFSGGNLTYNGTELTVPSTVNSINVSGDKYLDQQQLYSVPASNEERSQGDSQAIAQSPKQNVAQRHESSTEDEVTAIDPLSTSTSTSTSKSATRPAPVPAFISTHDSDIIKSSHKLKKFFGDDVPSTEIVTTNPAVTERPSYLSYDYDLTDISFNMEGNVKGGTLAALVERLTLHDYLDMNFNNTFLLTYRSFCTSTALLDLLEARYNLTPPSDISDEHMEVWRQKKLKLVRLRVFNILKNWLEVYYNEEDHIILDRLVKFTNTTIRTTLSFSTDQLERLIQKRKEGTEMDVGGLKKLVWTPQSMPQSILPRNTKKFKLLDLDPTELARQLTIKDFKMYSSIRPIECLDKSWSRETTDDAAPTAINIRASIEYCNQITSWVSDAILSQNDIKKRCNLIKFWVQVAEKCLELNNFNTCMAILSAFDNSSVGRLKRTWELVGARTSQVLSHIRKIMGANRNFSEYRQLIHSVNPPCIPFLGIYLQDLTFIEDGNSNVIKKSKDLINFAKREKTAEVIREIQQYQTLFYKLKTVDEMQAFIRTNLQSTRDEDQLYMESLKLEPREREDEKITRLLQESGFL
ncbi:ras guanine nucleotide exchange factor domain-containing protein [Absidia repens]|uniref:Ras guanine nucleotide exchange factor domain-containing protein n=1 Tax=Absidia repens TaxID=90262 RepID=A0A1X2IQ98_9FUNG|nr:ras guanine nucleotide exchange factor domain-containing protein [Absidia repens]